MFCRNLPINTEGIIEDADAAISLWMIEVITLVLAEVYTVPQDWGNLFFKLSLAEIVEFGIRDSIWALLPGSESIL